MGALGRVYGNGDLDLALTIRTFAIAEGRIHLWVGGGVVWDSDPEAEIDESWTKARPLLAAIGAPLGMRLHRHARAGRQRGVSQRYACAPEPVGRALFRRGCASYGVTGGTFGVGPPRATRRRLRDGIAGPRARMRSRTHHECGPKWIESARAPPAAMRVTAPSGSGGRRFGHGRGKAVRLRPLALAVSGRGLVDPDEPVLLADDEGFTRGRAAFETTRVYGGRPFRLGEHIARLERSAAQHRPRRLQTGPSSSASRRSRSSTPACRTRSSGCTGRPGAPGGEPVGIAMVGAIPDWIEEVAGSWAAARLAPTAAPLVALAAARHEVGQLRREHGRRGRGEASRRRRRGLRRRGRHRARGAGHEHLVARGRRPRDTVARARHPGGRDAGRPARARRGTGWVVEEGAYPLARLARRRRGVHVVIGPRGDARRRARRPARSSAVPPPTTSSVRCVLSPKADRGAAASIDPAGRRRPHVVRAVDDQVRRRDRVVALDVAILGGHPHVDPGRARRLPVAGDAAREPHVVRRLDPDPHRVRVAQRAVERTDAFDDHESRRLDCP